MAEPAHRTRNLGRLTEIAQVAVGGFGYFFERHRLTDLLPGRSRPALVEGTPSERGQHLREMLDELGPTFVKFGQLLSMRPDVLPPDIISELRGLQDDVRPFAYEDVERVIQEDLVTPSSDCSSSSTASPSPPLRSARFIVPCCRTARSSPSRCSAPARPPDRGRPGAALPGGAHREGAGARTRLPGRSRAGRRVRPFDPARARLPPGSTKRGHAAQELRRRPACRGAEGLLELHAFAGALSSSSRASSSRTSTRCRTGWRSADASRRSSPRHG